MGRARLHIQVHSPDSHGFQTPKHACRPGLPRTGYAYCLPTVFASTNCHTYLSSLDYLAFLPCWYITRPLCRPTPDPNLSEYRGWGPFRNFFGRFRETDKMQLRSIFLKARQNLFIAIHRELLQVTEDLSSSSRGFPIPPYELDLMTHWLKRASLVIPSCFILSAMQP